MTSFYCNDCKIMTSKQLFELKKLKSWLTLESVYVKDAATKNEGNIISPYWPNMKKLWNKTKRQQWLLFKRVHLNGFFS